MVLVESFSKKLKMSKGTNQPTRYPHRMKNQIFPESSEIFRQMSRKYFQQLRRAFRLPRPEDILRTVPNPENNQTAKRTTMHCVTVNASNASQMQECNFSVQLLQLFAICF